jgi:xanthine/uracil permease
MAGIYTVFQIVNAGFWMITTMGNEESITKWKKALSNSVVGFVVVMLAFLLMNTAVNYLLANKEDGKRVNFKDPLCYVYFDQNRCVIK